MSPPDRHDELGLLHRGNEFRTLHPHLSALSAQGLQLHHQGKLQVRRAAFDGGHDISTSVQGIIREDNPWPRLKRGQAQTEPRRPATTKAVLFRPFSLWTSSAQGVDSQKSPRARQSRPRPGTSPPTTSPRPATTTKSSFVNMSIRFFSLPSMKTELTGQGEQGQIENRLSPLDVRGRGVKATSAFN